MAASAASSQPCKESKNWCVYVHTNKANGKLYVERTSRKPEERWGNGNGYKQRQGPFYKAIQQYGWDGFNHEVVASGLTYEQSCEMEIKLIAEYHSTVKENGYNVHPGGDNFVAQIKPVYQFDRTGIFIREYPDCFTAAEDVKCTAGNIRMSCMGTHKTAMGYMWRYKDECDGTSAIEPYSYAGWNSVVQFDKNGNFTREYPSVKTAALLNGCSPASIRRVCAGGKLTTHDFMWRWRTDFDEVPEKIVPYHDPRKEPVYQYTMDKKFIAEYESGADAGRKLGLAPNGITEVCNGNAKHCGGYFWSREKIT